MSDAWAVIVAVIILMVVYAYISSKLEEKKRRKAREKSLPSVEDNVRAGCRYNVALSDSRRFENVEMVGIVGGEDGQYSFPGWEGMLVLKQANGKRLFLRQSDILHIEEL
jgi:hypothetical protein